jgi:hypothetical protein
MLSEETLVDKGLVSTGVSDLATVAGLFSGTESKTRFDEERPLAEDIISLIEVGDFSKSFRFVGFTGC